jgi:hypothetical protein
LEINGAEARFVAHRTNVTLDGLSSIARTIGVYSHLW